MRRTLGLTIATLLFATESLAGCIGPVIMGQCSGGEVPWDTSQPVPGRQREPDAGPGFHWDRTNDRAYQRANPDSVDPFNGKSAHDSTWVQGGRTFPGERTPRR